jgi:hypothetical protein
MRVMLESIVEVGLCVVKHRHNKNLFTNAAFLKSDKKRDGDGNEESWKVVPRPKAWLDGSTVL